MLPWSSSAASGPATSAPGTAESQQRFFSPLDGRLAGRHSPSKVERAMSNLGSFTISHSLLPSFATSPLTSTNWITSLKS